MKHFLFFALLAYSGFLKAQYKLEIDIANLRNSQGQIVIELMDAQKQTLKATRKKIENNQCIFVFNDLKNGRYAVQFFHDENSNGALDTNFLGIPTEGFGFSNNAFGAFGPKKFEEWLIKLSSDKKMIIQTRYF